MSRRSLMTALAASTVAVGVGAGALAAPAGAAPAPSSGSTRLVPINRIGIQLYSVRDKVSSLGFRAVFEELGRIGYSEIEFAGYTQGTVGAITPQQIRQLLDDNGLRAVGSHVGTNLLRSELGKQIEIAQILGTPHLGTGNAPTTVTTKAGYLAAAEEWNRWGQQVSAAGMKLYQHNHAGEFAFASDDPATRLYDLFYDNTDPRQVYLEMDVYWAYVGKKLYPGFEPLDYITRNPRRYPILHLKDGKTNNANTNGYDIVEFGAGNLPYQAFLSELRDRGQRFGVWEQDTAPTLATPPSTGNSLEAASRSYSAIAALRG
ncbi:sugar phosphate isomerase/epimerase [Rathayibacter rathayi]|uniref:Sugar phosphate isomerase/epimerase n=2 Tax=Rathayibacter rathayi TaxID=33887 RepID=A0ABD6W5E6_RATRA|nr:sugar phosphate isomerase/epimerase [Rathayibacter rathayi]MWV74446.1 TIM barrel protein [Rathayibacter rathayi NCPPB 2980 = VKM Ac-1601]PPF10482.1 sugar phosphate isomerase/epimerase [Rathayibacter rathayi]PPF21853.1 sugar phosphate isomerase/epimerase [Rathayibacter rathayi]PPF46468.1 sugar phosphate isomerase/epimerase [Rathayibacter rathayi]